MSHQNFYSLSLNKKDEVSGDNASPKNEALMGISSPSMASSIDLELDGVRKFQMEDEKLKSKFMTNQRIVSQSTLSQKDEMGIQEDSQPEGVPQFFHKSPEPKYMKLPLVINELEEDDHESLTELKVSKEVMVQTDEVIVTEKLSKSPHSHTPKFGVLANRFSSEKSVSEQNSENKMQDVDNTLPFPADLIEMVTNPGKNKSQTYSKRMTLEVVNEEAPQESTKKLIKPKLEANLPTSERPLMSHNQSKQVQQTDKGSQNGKEPLVIF